jgi:predicted DsbA family dithiol-disulfide isomerase
LAKEYDITIEGRAYLILPDTPEGGAPRIPRPGETDDELSEPLRSHAQDAGIIMRPPPVTPNTMRVLEATEYAQQQGKFMEFHWAAYKALWEDRQDLGDLAVIESIAESVGLNSTEMMERLESRHYTPTVMGQYQEALQYGISGIPTFLVGNLLFTGAHPYNIFKTAMDRVLVA